MSREKLRRFHRSDNLFRLIPWVGMAIAFVALRESGGSVSHWSFAFGDSGRPVLQMPLTLPLGFIVVLAVFIFQGMRRNQAAPAKVLLVITLAALIFFSPSLNVEPRGLNRFLRECNLTGKIRVPEAWATSEIGRLKSFTLASLEETDISLLPHGKSVPGAWLVIFENNLGVISLRLHPRNNENLRRVRAYYDQRQIDFDPRRGFELAEAYRSAPAWVKALEERTDEGWPVSRQKRTQDAVADTHFYLSRGIPGRAIDRLVEALEESPNDPHLTVRMQEILVFTKNYSQARKWAEVLDAMTLPAALQPAAQHARFLLYKSSSTSKD